MSAMSPLQEEVKINGVSFLMGAYTVGDLDGFCEWCRQVRARDMLGVMGIDPVEATFKQRMDALNQVQSVRFGDAVTQAYWQSPTGMARFVWACVQSPNKGTFSAFAKNIGNDSAGLGDALVMAFRLASPSITDEKSEAPDGGSVVQTAAKKVKRGAGT